MTKKWTIKQLSDAGALTYGDGYRTKRSEHGRPGYRILRVADVQDGGVAQGGDDYVHQDFRGSIGTKLSQPGDVLLTTKGTVGRVAIYPASAEQVVYSPQLCYFRVRDSGAISSRFLSYWFKTEEFRQQAARRANNTDMAAYINLRDIGSLEIDVPPISEQQAIAEVLGALDDKIAGNSRASSTAHDLSNAHIRRTLSLHIGRPVSLGNLADKKAIEFGDGYRTKRSEHGTPGIRILRAGDVRDFRLIPDGSDFVSTEYRKRIGAKVSRAGDIVLTTKGTVGRVAVVPPHLEEVAYSPQTCYFRVQDEGIIDSGFLAAWFSSRGLVDQLSVYMHKSDMAPYVNLQDIRSLRIPLPEINVQKAEGDLQRSLIGFMHAMSRENDILAHTRDELLPLLMSDRIRVRDAEKVVEEVV